MAIDSIIPTRRAVIAALTSEPTITDLVPAQRIYPPRTIAKPVWPFIRYGQASWTPVSATGVTAGVVSVAIHAYANGGDEVAGEITAALVKFLFGPDDQGLSLSLADGRAITIFPQQSQVIQDGDESNSWHGFVTCRILVAN